MDHFDLEKCAEQCVSWCDDAIQELNDSQKVEFFRMVEYANATKLQYKKLIISNRGEIKRLSEKNLLINITMIALVLVEIFAIGIDSNSTQLTLAVFLIIFTIRDFNIRNVSRQANYLLLDLEKDFNSINIPLSLISETIAHEESEHEKYFMGSEEDKKAYGYKSWVLNIFIKKNIMELVTNYKIKALFPSCSYNYINS